MSRITPVLAQLLAHKRTALIPYVTAGFPYPDITPDLMHGMVAAGANVIELGVPFSDPSADGAVIQKAGDKALAAGIGLAQVLDMVRVFRRKDNDTPDCIARRQAAWIAGPSALGSLYGIPSSSIVAPASTAARASSTVSSGVGSPSIRNGLTWCGLPARLRCRSASVTTASPCRTGHNTCRGPCRRGRTG